MEVWEWDLRQLLEEARKTYHVFHIHLKDNYNSSELDKWKNLLGENLISLDNYNLVAEVIASTIAIVNGVDMEDIINTFSPSSKHSLTNALSTINSSIQKSNNLPNQTNGVLTL